MSISYPRTDVAKFLVSTPSRFVGACKSDSYYLMQAHDNHKMAPYAAKADERIFRQFLELAVEIAEYDGKSIFVPDYTHISANFCIALSVLFGKRFDSHGLIQQHGRAYVPVSDGVNVIYNKSLYFNSLSARADYGVSLDLSNFDKVHRVLFEQESALKAAQETFFYAGRFYAQSLRQVEDSPEIAFLSLITVGEILSAYFEYPLSELIDNETKELLMSLRGIERIGNKLANQVEARLRGVSEGFCRHLQECLDDDFFKRSEATHDFERLRKEDIRQRLKAAYDVRSQFVHAGKFQFNWMSVNYLHNNEEIISGNPVAEDKNAQRMIKRSPTFIGLERIMRYALIKFLVKTHLVESW